MDNFFKDMFIDEAKAALSKDGAVNTIEIMSELNTKAPIESPAFTGVVKINEEEAATKPYVDASATEIMDDLNANIETVNNLSQDMSALDIRRYYITNLFNKDSDENAVDPINNSRIVSHLIPVKPGATYWSTGHVDSQSGASTYYTYPSLYTEDGTLVNDVWSIDSYTKDGWSYTIPEDGDIAYMRIRCRTDSIDTVIVTQGETPPVTYAPYGETKLYIRSEELYDLQTQIDDRAKLDEVFTYTQDDNSPSLYQLNISNASGKDISGIYTGTYLDFTDGSARIYNTYYEPGSGAHKYVGPKTLTEVDYPFSIDRGGTGAKTAEDARTNLGAMADVSVTTDDAGKVLRVNSEGAWAAEDMSDDFNSLQTQINSLQTQIDSLQTQIESLLTQSAESI